MIKTVAPVCLAVLFASTVMADSGDTPHALVLSAALARATASPLLAIDQNRVTVVDRIVAQWGEALSRSDAGVGSEQLREMLMSIKEHEMHHRGQLMLVERMIGIVPHLTRQMQERHAQRAAAAAAQAR